MKKTINQVINGKEYSIVIDHSSIAAKTSTGLYPIMKLSRNKDYVIKFNRTTISTCNSEMLIYLIENDIDIIIEIVNHISRIAISDKKISRAAFYNIYMNDENGNNIVEFFNNASHNTRQLIIRDHMCDDHTAKMSGMISYSTSVEENIFCIARMHCNHAVCKHCFAYRQLGIYADQRKKLKRAHAIATRCEWSIADIPFIDYREFPYFRLESFGDINNSLQVKNYNTLAMVNAQNGIMTTLWTKNPGIIQNAINNGLQLSSYLTIGLSSLELNKPEVDKAKRYSFIRFLFTVYDENYISDHNVNINCGGRHCLSCLNCYELAASSNELILINEKLK